MGRPCLTKEQLKERQKWRHEKNPALQKIKKLKIKCTKCDEIATSFVKKCPYCKFHYEIARISTSDRSKKRIYLLLNMHTIL